MIVSIQHLQNTGCTSRIVPNRFRLSTHSRYQPARSVPLLFTLSGAKLRPRAAQSPATVTLLVSHSQPACVSQSILSAMLFCPFLLPASFSVRPHSAPWMSTHSLFCRLPLLMLSMFTSYIMTEKTAVNAVCIGPLCVMCLHTGGSISRRLIIGSKCNTFEICLDTPNCPSRSDFFKCSFYSILLLHLFFHPWAWQGPILITTRSF